MAFETEDDWLNPKRPGARAALSLGTMNFGERTKEAEAARIIARALERGVAWIDTANAYGGGDSERFVGRALRGKRYGAKVATKVGIGRMGGPNEGLAPEVVRAALEASLERLSLEHIDLYYLHAPDAKTPIAATLEVLEAARQAGKIGAFAISNYSAWRISEMTHLCAERGWARPRVSQVVCNLLVRQLELEYFDYAKHAGLHTTIYNPLAGGLLAGKGMDTVEPGSRFDDNPRYRRRYLTDRMRELARAYAELARDAGIDRVHLAYGWLSQQPGVDSIVLGPATLEQLDSSLDGCAQVLDKEILGHIDEIHRAYVGTDAKYAR